MSPATVAVRVNGETRRVVAGATLADVVAEVCGGSGGGGVAVAVDRTVVPKSSWESVVVGEGDLVEVVTAAAGG